MDNDDHQRRLQQNIRATACGRTVIMIAHRLAAVRDADRIITVERGRGVEDGAYEELVRSGGRYAALWQFQVTI